MTERAALLSISWLDLITLLRQVMLDRVRAPTHRQPGLEVHFQAQLGPEADAGHALAARLRVRRTITARPAVEARLRLY